MTDTTDQTTPRHAPPGSSNTARKAIIAGGIGNVVEWYDYGIYAALSPVIARLFFPSASVVAATLATFAVFGVGFVVRPLGGFFFGALGDRRGRRVALALALIMVSLSTFGMGLLPTFASAGALAPALLVVLRIVQGFSAGGEWTGSAALMIENARPGRRGWIASWQQFSVILGTLVGLLVVTTISTVWSEQALYSWGWRVPFLIALLLGGVGLYLRLRIEETPHFKALEQNHRVAERPTREALRTQRGPMVRAMLFTALPNVGFYTFVTYTPTFLKEQGGLSLPQAYLVNLAGQLCYAVLTPVIGRLSDRVGRRRLLLVHAAAFFVLAVPIYLAMSHGSFVLALLVQLPALLIMAFYAGPGTAALIEMFPTRVRYSGLAIPYNISSALFGGTAPFIATGLIALLHTPLAPAFYAMAVAIPTFLVYLTMRETAFEPLRDT